MRNFILRLRGKKPVYRVKAWNTEMVFYERLWNIAGYIPKSWDIEAR